MSAPPYGRRMLRTCRRALWASVAAIGGAFGADGEASAAATPQIAAYERYVSGNGFDIGLVNAATGQTLAVPAAVNSAADEYHPALTPDGRYLVFTRTTLTPQPDGDVVPPADRRALILDRQTGAIRDAFGERPADPGTGATIVPTATSSLLAYGLRFRPGGEAGQPRVVGGLFNTGLNPRGFDVVPTLGRTQGFGLPSVAGDPFFDFPHAAVRAVSGLRLKATLAGAFDPGDGRARALGTFLIAETLNPSGSIKNTRELALRTGLPRHATPRFSDGHVALDITGAVSADIATIQFPGDSEPSVLGAVKTASAERMPAWSPDGVQLGFVRTTGTNPRRNLLVFDSTAGIQAVVNPAVDLGEEAPTPQLRDFQDTWGGLSLANTSSADSVVVTCGTACTGALAGQATGTGVTLGPRVGGPTRVGILIARVVGTRRLFGHPALKIRRVGRVPLGPATTRNPRFRWNGRVNGRRLAAGDYLLTFRALTAGGRVTSTSRSIRFTLTRAGRIARVRAVR